MALNTVFHNKNNIIVIPKILEKDASSKKELFNDINPSLNNPIYLDVYNNLLEKYIDSKAIDKRYNNNGEKELLIKFFELPDDKSEWITINDNRIDSNIKDMPDYLNWRLKLNNNDIIIFHNHFLGIIKNIKKKEDYDYTKKKDIVNPLYKKMIVEIYVPFSIGDIISINFSDYKNRIYVGEISGIEIDNNNDIIYVCEYNMYKEIHSGKIIYNIDIFDDFLHKYINWQSDLVKKMRIIKKKNIDLIESVTINVNLTDKIKQYNFLNNNILEYKICDKIIRNNEKMFYFDKILKKTIVLMEIFMLYSKNGYSIDIDNLYNFRNDILYNSNLFTYFQKKHITSKFMKIISYLKSEKIIELHFDKYLDFIFTLSNYNDEKCDCCNNNSCFLTIFKFIINCFEYDYFLEKKNKNKFLFEQKKYKFSQNVFLFNMNEKIENIERTLYYIINKRFLIENFGKKIEGKTLLELYFKKNILKKNIQFSIYNLIINYPKKICNFLTDISHFIKNITKNNNSILPPKTFLFNKTIKEYIENVKNNYFSILLNNNYYFFLVRKNFLYMYKNTHDIIYTLFLKNDIRIKDNINYLIKKINNFYSLLKKIENKIKINVINKLHYCIIRKKLIKNKSQIILKNFYKKYCCKKNEYIPNIHKIILIQKFIKKKKNIRRNNQLKKEELLNLYKCYFLHYIENESTFIYNKFIIGDHVMLKQKYYSESRLMKKDASYPDEYLDIDEIGIINKVCDDHVHINNNWNIECNYSNNSVRLVKNDEINFMNNINNYKFITNIEYNKCLKYLIIKKKKITVIKQNLYNFISNKFDFEGFFINLNLSKKKHFLLMDKEIIKYLKKYEICKEFIISFFYQKNNLINNFYNYDIDINTLLKFLEILHYELISEIFTDIVQNIKMIDKVGIQILKRNIDKFIINNISIIELCNYINLNIIDLFNYTIPLILEFKKSECLECSVCLEKIYHKINYLDNILFKNYKICNSCTLKYYLYKIFDVKNTKINRIKKINSKNEYINFNNNFKSYLDWYGITKINTDKSFLYFYKKLKKRYKYDFNKNLGEFLNCVHLSICLTNPKYIICPNDECIINDKKNIDININKNIFFDFVDMKKKIFIDKSKCKKIFVTCPQCDIKICTTCHLEYHSLTKCNSNYKLNIKYILESMDENGERNFTQCPHCSIFTFRSSGCDHIKCKCNFEYCFKCLKPSSDQTCKYGYDEPEGHGPPVTLDIFLQEFYKEGSNSLHEYDKFYDSSSEEEDINKLINVITLDEYEKTIEYEFPKLENNK
jgi:hypothetical protein